MNPTDHEPSALLDRWLSHPAVIAAWLAFVTLAVYLPVMGYDYVAFDDYDYVVSNPHVMGGLTADGVRWAFTTGHGSNWHPLTWLSLMLDVSVWHGSAGGLHLTNLLLHLANTVLLFLLLRRLTRTHWRSALVAGLFALHPLHVESVAWVAERKDVLSTFFGLLSVWCYYEWQKAKGKGQKHYLAALLCFALSLMSKPMLVTLPCVLLLLDWWPLGRMQNWRLLIVEKIPFFALSAASSVVTFLVQQHGGAVQSQMDYPWVTRLGNALVSYLLYLGKIFWPAKLAVLYPHPGQWPWLAVMGAAALLLALTALALHWRTQRPYALMGWLWFLGTLVPVIGLVQVGVQGMADRYTYLPSIGLFIIVVWSAGDWLAKQHAPAWVGKLLGYTLLGACAVAAADQVEHWRNSETLFRHALAVTTRNHVAHNDLGYHLQTHGRMDEAVAQYQAALAIKTNYADALNNLGFALAQQGRSAEAKQQYEAALRANPGQVEARNNLGMILDEQGQLDEAIAEYRRVLALDPGHANAHGNLGISLARQGKLDEAVAQFREALRLKPGDAIVHNNFGAALGLQKKFTEAAAEYREALRLRPDYAEAHNNLGAALAQLGRRAEAVAELKEALRLKPDYAEARRQLEELGAAAKP